MERSELPESSECLPLREWKDRTWEDKFAVPKLRQSDGLKCSSVSGDLLKGTLSLKATRGFNHFPSRSIE